MNKDPIMTQNAKKVFIKDQVLKIRTPLEAVQLISPGQEGHIYTTCDQDHFMATDA